MTRPRLLTIVVLGMAVAVVVLGRAPGCLALGVVGVAVFGSVGSGAVHRARMAVRVLS